jgi:ABC-type multidrug transport system fused ATPase/permease subunit
LEARETPVPTSAWAALHRRFRLLTPRERRQWTLLSGIGVVRALLETLLGAAVYAVLLVLVSPGQGDSWLGPLLRRFPALRDPAQILWVLLGLAAFQAVKTVFFLAVGLLHGFWVSKASNELAARLFRAYLDAPYALHLRRNSAELTQNVLTHVLGLYWLFGGTIGLIADVLTLAGLVVVAGSVTPAASLLVAGGAAVSLGAFLRLSRSRVEAWGRRRHELSVRLMRHVQQGLGGIKELRVLGRERSFYDSLVADQVEVARIDVTSNAMSALPKLGTEAIFGLGVILTVGLAVRSSGDLSTLVPLLGLFTYLGMKAIPTAHSISMALWGIRFHVGMTDAVANDLETLPEPRPDSPREPRLPFRDAIEVEGLCFRYDDAAPPVLRDLSLRIRRGESVGIVGATGAGKTTLVDLILGLHTPSSGEIRIDGSPLERVLRRWQDAIGYVPQSLYLVDDTLRRNIALGVPDARIDEAAVWSALRVAQLERFVAGLPAGLDSAVGERGVRLSGGERQRIAIARALYHDPDVLVFDEATASLDPATERELTEAFDALRGRKTLLVIAHRLSTVERCDRLLLLRNGRIEADGPYSVLVERSEAFRIHAGLQPRVASRP